MTQTLWKPLVVLLALATSLGAAEPPKKLRLIFICPFVEYDFFKPVKRGMADAAAAMGVEATFTGTADGDVKALAGLVRKAVDDGYDGIAVNLIDPTAYDEAVAEARRRGVPVVAFNMDDRQTPNARLAAVCQDVYAAGRTLGRESAAFVAEKSQVLLTMHDAGVSSLDDRRRGAQDELRPRGVTWVELITGTDRERAVERIRAALEAHPQIRVVLATGKADTEAAGLAIERHFSGRGYAAAGFDLSPETLRLVKAGIIRFTIDQQPYVQGYYPVVALALQLRYGIKPSNIDSGAAVITRNDVDQILQLGPQQVR